MDDDETRIADLEERLSKAKNALGSLAMTSERLCARILSYQPVVDAARALVKAYETSDDENGPDLCVALVVAVRGCQAPS